MGDEAICLKFKDPMVSLGNQIARDGLRQTLDNLVKQGEACTAINLADNGLGDEGARTLWEVLREKEHLCRLDLVRCGIGHEGYKDMGNLLRDHAAIQCLILGGNVVGNDGIPAEFCSGLDASKSLLQLHLSHCQLTAAACQPFFDSVALRNRSLVRLNLSYNKLDAVAAADLARVLEKNPTLQQLDLSGNILGPKGAEWIANGVYKNGSKLQQLKMDRNAVQERGARALLRFWTASDGKHLKHLDLRENDLTQKNVHDLCHMLGKHLHHELDFDNGARRVLLSWPEKLGSIVKSPHGHAINVFWRDEPFPLAEKKRQWAQS